MNFLAHGLPYLDQPYIVAGTAVPDWLSVVDRRIRAKSKYAVPLTSSDDSEIRETAVGIINHHRDDQWFHSSRLFNETMLGFAIELRDQLPGDEGFRPSFVGHILVEMLMDATLISRDRSTAERYYEAIESVSALKIQAVVNQMTPYATTELAPVIARFVKSRFLYDYLENDKLLMRLNQVMNRVGLPLLSADLIPWLQTARQLIDGRCDALRERQEFINPP